MRDAGGWPPLVDALLFAAVLIGLIAFALDLARKLAIGLLLIFVASCAA